MLYLLIAMWIYAAVPDKMVMVIAIIFGAHLLPFGWLYDSKVYYFMLVGDGVLHIVNVVEHRRAKRDDEKVGRDHPPTRSSFNMLSHNYLQK